MPGAFFFEVAVTEEKPGLFDHLRIEVSDDYDLVQSVALRACPGGVLLLDIETAYKHPTLEDARDGVAVVFGPNVAYVTIPNLPERYQTFAEPGRYSVAVVFVPYRFTREPTTVERMMETSETEVQPDV